ncbi:MAG: cation transporter, partial [Micrococcaceae bacterium]|nr:cation transporter [Micrococcaceae bacterium]
MTTAETTTHTLLRAEGFSCPSCVSKIEKQVGKLKGVENVKVHFASARIEVDHDESK